MKVTLFCAALVKFCDDVGTTIMNVIPEFLNVVAEISGISLQLRAKNCIYTHNQKN